MRRRFTAEGPAEAGHESIGPAEAGTLNITPNLNTVVD